jgi:hypothetical protein
LPLPLQMWLQGFAYEVVEKVASYCNGGLQGTSPFNHLLDWAVPTVWAAAGAGLVVQAVIRSHVQVLGSDVAMIEPVAVSVISSMFMNAHAARSAARQAPPAGSVSPD